MTKENGNGAAAPNGQDTYTGSNGKTYRREDYEAPDRPGHVRRGTILTGTEFLACASWGLTSWLGNSMVLLHTSRDRIKDEEAPDELKAEFNEAKQQLELAEKISADAMAKWDAATHEIATLEKLLGGRGVNERGYTHVKDLQQVEHQADRASFIARGLCDEARSVFMTAQNKMEAWKRREYQRRVQAAQQTEAEKSAAPTLTLGERIAAFVRP